MDDKDTTWARQNKKVVAREFIRRSGLTPSEEPSAIFTAGLPGAGKTEFTLGLLPEILENVLRIDMDEIASTIEGYKPEVASRFRAGASIILSKIFDLTLKTKIDFILDGTFSREVSLENLDRALKAGYKVKIYLIVQEPQVAWQFTKSRELVEKRCINRNEFIDTYFMLMKNLNSLQKTSKNVTISIILKDSKNKEGRRIEDVENVLDHLPEILTREELEKMII
jgi:UDP-N-acetylglucosamine kinase